jgi:hypothetical protein
MYLGVGSQGQGSEVKPRPDDSKSNTSELGELKGPGREEYLMRKGMGRNEESSTQQLINRQRVEIKTDQLRKLMRKYRSLSDKLDNINVRGKMDYPTLHHEKETMNQRLELVENELVYEEKQNR